MAQVTFFHYIHQNTPLHQMDGRFKLLGMLLLTISVSLATQWYHYIGLMVVVGLALVGAKLPLLTILKEMRLFSLIIVIIFLTSGLPHAGQLVLMLTISTVMVGTTSLLTVKNTIEWYLRPIPLIPEVRIATIVNLTFVLIPVIFDQYVEMMHAQKARCIELRKNPIRRVKFIVFPLLSRTLRRADALVHAMEARCYSETRTPVVFKTNKLDWLMLAVCLAVLIAVIVL